MSGKWNRHSDWQPKPKMMLRLLPVCPICKRATKWGVYDEIGWTSRSYKVSCDLCGAEWLAKMIEQKDAAKTVLLGPFLSGSFNKMVSFPNENSILELVNIGTAGNQDKTKLMGQDIPLNKWREIATESRKFCPECGFKITSSEKFCPECGFKL